MAELNSDFAFIARFLPPCVTPLLDALCFFTLLPILIDWLEIYYNQHYWAKIAGRILFNNSALIDRQHQSPAEDMAYFVASIRVMVSDP